MLQDNKNLLNRSNVRNKIILISSIAIIFLASVAVFYYLISKTPIQDMSKVTEEVGMFGGKAHGRGGYFCSIKLKSGKTVTMSCPDKNYRLGQEVVFYKFTNASGTESYKVPNEVDMILKKPNPSFKRDYLR